MVHVFLIIFLDVSCTRLLQQVVTAIHQHAEAVQGSHHLGYIGDDRLLLVRNSCHKLIGDARIYAEFHLLRVDEHELQFVRMLLVE